MFEKILIANRGEIALRIQRTCREMGIATVAVHSVDDSEAMHVRLADESVCVGGGGGGYMDVGAIIEAGRLSGAGAVHPGYGFLSENARFARLVGECGMVFIGPGPEQLEVMGDKAAARRAAVDMGLQVVPGSGGVVGDVEEAIAAGERAGWPVMVKAAAGGGGRGMRVAEGPGDVGRALEVASNEARAAFGDGSVYVEKYLARPRHIEIQVIGDGAGGCVHLFERDCSVQRRHQKLMEETPSPALVAGEAERMAERVAAALGGMGYAGAGTVEFLYEDGEFYFIEMNTRLQVEHGVSEMACGVDIVREQIRVAAGEGLSLEQGEIERRGHVLECRINAERWESGGKFLPSCGEIVRYHAPGGTGVRVDSALYGGWVVRPFYDGMLAKVMTLGEEERRSGESAAERRVRARAGCLARMRRALGEMVVEGVDTGIGLCSRLLEAETLRRGEAHVHWLEGYLARGMEEAGEGAEA